MVSNVNNMSRLFHSEFHVFVLDIYCKESQDRCSSCLLPPTCMCRHHELHSIDNVHAYEDLIILMRSELKKLSGLAESDLRA